ncbi:proteasome regulatory subunit C-terminal-domain-containing protein [Fimicolochytrium jonesii]|uniref:proteasome regulatory subunit C-terminal-domain-containing protein n=1 Tax=Fimicolochytrium jonesii TaxID=1396493 RepID=UPI0022FE2607|nr:proteasome regulatory subunit C-terminal-domain-containing protein [Fimicolochytrium jonesii]KAI8816805.1 proteasome regulatory subunit C-terminal-domain-containing protein [Fimicolochytrium jonesii]
MVETRASKAKKAEEQQKGAAPEKSGDVVPMETEKSEEEKKAESNALVLADIKQNLALLDRAVATLESRFTTRALRATASIRKRLNQDLLAQAIETHVPQEKKGGLLKWVGKSSDAMDVDQPATDGKESKTFLPEHEIYLNYLVLLWLHDQHQNEKGMQLVSTLVEHAQALNRRTLDQLSGRLYFYLARFHELSNTMASARPVLLAVQRTATLRHDDDTQATILNLLLRNYLHFNLYDQADKLVSKTVFPEGASNNQIARYMYYLGRIKAIQLDYTASHRHLLQAIRKGPTSPASAGFQQAVNKLAIIVQLLMGEIPDRAIFRQPMLRKSLVPYLQITQAVRIGDLAKFQETLGQHNATFRTDKTLTLILRLRHNVIKTGVRMISLSYSRISLRDICLKLQLDSEEDAEYIVAKAIRDGVIDASINHEEGYVKSKENVDIYSTNEPQHAFNQRITFCLNLHNESVKALRFPQDAHRKELANATALREEERKLAKEIVDGEMGDDDDMGGDEW